jgi:hypothetical protein
MYDSDKAGSRTSRMWLKLGSLLEKAAYGAAEGGDTTSAMRRARAAAVCFWQATGDGDFDQLKDIA